MTYPGDNNLSEDIRQRVEGTYRQSRQLALAGKIQEATLGCEFVLRLDPLYEPARELTRKLEAGESLAEEAAGADGSGAEAPVGEADPAAAFDQPAEPQAPPEPDFDLDAQIEDLMERRDFRTLLSLAEDHRPAIDAKPELAQAVATATERLEAEPYVRSFLEAAESAQRQGREEEALALLEKVRVLDPSHPSVPAESPKSVHFEEENDRIRELLEEGQRALERGDHQAAIDSWSRIFLIDIDHSVADQLIKDARRQKAERERQIEEAFHEGVSLFELGSTDKARQQFEKVVALDSSHHQAKEYLQGMDVAELPELEGGAEPSGDVEVFVPPDPVSADQGPAAEEDEESSEAAAGLPPEAGAEDDVLADDAPLTPPRKTGLLANRRFLTIAGAAVVVLLAVFALLYLKRDTFFPNSADVPVVSEIDALARARKLHEAGQIQMAIAQLNRLPTDHSQYAEAQALIAQWQAPPEVEPEPTGPSEEDLAQRDALVELARASNDNREFLAAAAHFREAAQLAPLEDDDLLLQEEVQQNLAGLESQVELFEQGDWEFVLPDLWRLHQANPDDKDVVRLMVDSYYNLGVRDLQRGDTSNAGEKFERAVELDPSDADVERLLRFSQVYDERSADLLYRIFVKYLPFR